MAFYFPAATREAEPWKASAVLLIHRHGQKAHTRHNETFAKAADCTKCTPDSETHAHIYVAFQSSGTATNRERPTDPPKRTITETEAVALWHTYLLDVAAGEPLELRRDGREVNARVYSVLRHGHLQDLLPRLSGATHAERAKHTTEPEYKTS